MAASMQGLGEAAAETLYWGVLISLVFYGVILGQIWKYFKRNHDTWLLRTLVGILIAGQTLSAVLDALSVQFFMITNFGNAAALEQYPYSITVGISVTVVSTFIIQIFFAYKVYLLTKPSYLAPLVTTLAALASCAAGIAMTIHSSRRKVRNFNVDNLTIVSSCLYSGFALMGDLVVTYILIIRLRRSRTGIRSTRQVLRSLIIYIVTRGILVTTIQVGNLIVYATVLSTVLTHSAVHFVTGKFYIMTMMSMLNNRQKLRQTLNSCVSDIVIDIGPTTSQEKDSERNSEGYSEKDTQDILEVLEASPKSPVLNVKLTNVGTVSDMLEIVKGGDSESRCVDDKELDKA